MKKVFKIISIAVICIVATMAIIPLAFKDKIKDIIISEASKYINAEFGFEDLNISLFREFPQASLGIEGFWLRGKEEFANDTLIYVNRAEAAVNVMSIFGNSGFDITKILVKDTYLKAIVSDEGHANWDIIPTTDTIETEEPEDTAISAFRILLQKVAVDNLNIIYDDRKEDLYAHIEGFGATCQGDMAADKALLKLQAAIRSLTFKMDDIPLLSNAHISTDLNIDADFVNSRYTLKENTLSLNAIKATINGWAAIPADSPMSMNLELGTSDISFKEILSLIPSIYAKDFEDLKADGIVNLTAYAKGELTDTTLPEFEASLKVKDGNFRYPSLPAGIDNIQITAKVSNPGSEIDLTEVNLEQFSLSMLGNPFAVSARVKTPISDPDFALSAKGTLDLDRVKDVYPLEDITLNGLVKADIDLNGRLSYIEKEQYEQFKANGTLNLQNMKVNMAGIPDVVIEKSTFTVTPHHLNLNETQVLIGDNDITAHCQFDNYIAFVLKGETLKGQLNLKSQHMNLNDFMSSDNTESNTEEPKEETTEEEDSTGTLIIPKNIDFNMNVDMDEIRFEDITLHNLNGRLKVKNGMADMTNLSMQVMGGTAVMNGSYSTANSETEPELKAAFALKELSFAQTFKELALARQMAPIFEKLNGNFSGKITVDTKLDESMTPQFETLNASGSLNTHNLSLSDIEIINQIATTTGRDELKNLSVKDLNIDFTIEDGRVYTKPFDITTRGLNLNLSGSTGLDQTIDYKGRLTLPQSSTSPISHIDLKIGGKFAAPKITIDSKSMVHQIAEAATQTATNKAVEAVGKQLGIDISDAEKQKAELMKTAQQAAGQLVTEAEKQKANLISKAGSNTLKKLAAEKAGDALIAKAKEKGAQLIAEAEKRGNELIEKTKKQ